MLRAKIYEDVIAATKAQDRVKLEVVRYIWSEIKRVEIDAKHELNDEEVIDLLRKEIKKRVEAVALMKQSGREDVINHEEAQLMIINTYVPTLMSKEEIIKVVEEVTASFAEASAAKDFGKVMGVVMSKIKGKADGKMVQEVVKAKLL